MRVAISKKLIAIVFIDKVTPPHTPGGEHIEFNTIHVAAGAVFEMDDLAE